MKDIEPNPKLNKIAAGLVGIFALYFFYLAYDTSTLVESNEWGFEWGVVAVLAGIGGLLMSYAIVLLRSSPINSARLRFRSGGFRLETKKVFRGSKVIDLDWADITTVTSRKGGRYRSQWIRVAHGRAGEVAMFSPAWTNCDSKVIIERLQASAKASDYMLEKEAGGWFAHRQERWTVIQKT